MSATSRRQVAILLETDDTWGRNVVEAIVRSARASGWSVLISPRDAERRLRLPPRWNGDGVIVSLRDAAIARHVRRTGLPAVDVSITMPEERWLARVATDDTLRAQAAFDHLRSCGLKRFACYAPPIGRYPNGRAEAFARVVREAGFDCATFTSDRSRERSGWLADYKRAAAWLSRLEKPLAVFASDPYPARQFAEICERMEIRIPDEVALLSGDNDELLCRIAWPQITSVELASHQIGDEACRLLAAQMAGASVPAEPVLLPPLRILPRHSTSTLAINDSEFAQVLAAIRDRATDCLEVRHLLDEFPISRRGLELKFKRYLGRTPAAEIRRVKLERVRHLLLKSDRSIDSIAASTGFSSGPALSNTFRKHFGITPGSLRKSRAT